MKRLNEALGAMAREEGDALVVRPRTDKELAAAMMVLRERQLTFGARVRLDRGAFDRLGPFELDSQTVHVGAGVLVRDVEARAAVQHLTLGPLPPGALELSVGALLEDPRFFAHVVVPGRLEPLAARVTGVLPDGVVVSSAPGPRHAAGPDLAALFFGAQGRLGVVTAAVLRLSARPEIEQHRLFSFASHAGALDALRETLSKGVIVSRAVLTVRGGRTLVASSVAGSRGRVERELELLHRTMERAGGRFEGHVSDRGAEGALHESSWADLASALQLGATVELFRLSLSTVVARGTGVREFEPTPPLARMLTSAFDRAGVLGRAP